RVALYVAQRRTRLAAFFCRLLDRAAGGCGARRLCHALDEPAAANPEPTVLADGSANVTSDPARRPHRLGLVLSLPPLASETGVRKIRHAMNAHVIHRIEGVRRACNESFTISGVIHSRLTFHSSLQ